MKRAVAVVASIFLAGMAATAAAEDKAAPPMTAEQKAQADAYQRMSELRPEHKQLAYFVGSWKTKSQVWMDSAAAALESTGSSKAVAIYGGRYVTMSFEGLFFGQPFQGQGQLGFDNLRGKFFSTWIDSGSTGFWLSWGDYDKASNAWTFLGEMPDPLKPQNIVKVRQVMRIYDDKHYGFDWYEFKDGKETRTMNIDYRRE
ncbi:uncharacterized protein DUF1579 [Tahibacter aquaticus]|uniref:Uncharacterized protein DUF1579 n=1 Tax=Tahibacter aquaticus TaxID=520092 RepID=A0A4R6YSG3_9GAMM|nr:DUF1579 domain-containing protein [Tahibacter aquaticus]TDR41150.1 uncharacterized protein DUF1579 [Tahibacter aquaticus]